MNQNSEPYDITMSHEAIKVKNAHLICRCDLNIPNSWDLWHYKTKILSIRNNVIELIKPCSDSSVRAINQALTFLGFKQTCQQICKELERKGVKIDKSY